MNAWHASHYRRWFAAARSDRIGRAPLGVTVLDRPIVIARLPDGALLALEDRCPHRHAPLSAGRTVADGIACPYHGWTFDAAGCLLRIPGLAPDEPLPAVRARAVAVREHDGLVWVRPDAGDDALPSLVRALVPSTRRHLWQTTWRANVIDAMENFLDPMHTHLIHPGLVRGGGQRAPMTVALVHAGDGFSVDYTCGHGHGQQRQSGLLYRLFESPRTRETATFAAPGSTQIAYRYANDSVVRISLHFTPVAADRTLVFATLHVENRWAPEWLVRALLWPFLRRVGAQDSRMLALQSANIATFGARQGASTRLDIVRASLERFWTHGELPDASADRTQSMLL